MKISCPHSHSDIRVPLDPKFSPIVRNGSFFRKSDSRHITRYFCRICKTYFSQATLRPFYFQKKRRITRDVYLLLNSGVSQRRAARLLRVNPKTVVRRFRLLSELERIRHKEWLRETYSTSKLKLIQFDDLETAEHTKCKPLSVSLAVDPKTRKILCFQVSRMPAKGPLAKVARRKYGYRKDERPRGWNRLMKELVPVTAENATWRSDQNPHYPKFLFRHHPKAIHEAFPGARGATTGQGELKKLVFDPLFTLNHSCAMLRANLNRLFRRTWCISKTKQGLIDHLSIYVTYHNLVLTRRCLPESAILGGS